MLPPAAGGVVFESAAEDSVLSVAAFLESAAEGAAVSALLESAAEAAAVSALLESAAEAAAVSVAAVS